MKQFLFLTFTIVFFTVAQANHPTHVHPVQKKSATTRLGGGVLSKIGVQLFKQFDTLFKNMDGLAIVFDSSFSNGYGLEDATKFTNSTDNISVREGSYLLSIDGRKPPSIKDTLSLVLQQVTTNNYQLHVDGSFYVSNGVVPYIYDKYLSKDLEVKNKLNVFAFSIDTSKGNSYKNRFYVIFKPVPLPIKTISLKASLQGNNTLLQWQNNDHMIHFEIERSLNKGVFETVGIISNISASDYNLSFLDRNLLEGNYYYRLKAVNPRGEIGYSTGVVISVGRAGANYLFYPNPFGGKQLNIQLTNALKGKYYVDIHNWLGQLIDTEVFEHQGGSDNFQLNLEKQLIKGLYTIGIRNASGQRLYLTNMSVQQ